MKDPAFNRVVYYKQLAYDSYARAETMECNREIAAIEREIARCVANLVREKRNGSCHM